MEKHINEVLPGDLIVRDIVSKQGMLLLGKGKKATRALIDLLKKHSVTRIWVL